MEYVFEFIFELIFEGSIELSKSKKVPKWIRYPLVALIILFFAMVISLIFLVGILTLRENIFVSFIFIVLGLFMFVMSIVKFKKVYLNKK